MDVREFDAAQDSGPVAELFNRCKYGPVTRRHPLTPDGLDSLMTERVPLLVMVAARDKELVGCLGFLLSSGRRVAAPGECFAGMFVIDQGYRNSVLAGSLFTQSFEKLVDLGIRTLRTEANPSNTRAYPLYSRAGFRGFPGLPPDEDGYAELISHLPGIVGDLLASDLPGDLRKALPRLNWRNIASARSSSPFSGVTLEGGRHVVEYDLRADNKRLLARVELASGRVLSYSVVGDEDAKVLTASPQEDTVPDHEVSSWSVGRSSRLTVDSGGLLAVHVDGHLGPVLVDPLPGVAGIAPVGWRRPRRAPARVTVRPDGCDVEVSEGGHVLSRTATVAGNEIHVRSTLHTGGGAELLAAPWVSMRMAQKYVRAASGELVGAAVVRGVWPQDFTDFEGALPPDPTHPTGSAEVVWQDASTRLRAFFDTGSDLRHEGLNLPLMRSSSGTVGYRLLVETRVDHPPLEASSPRGVRREPLVRHGSAGARDVVAEPALWRTASRGRREVVSASAGDQSVSFAPAASGLVEWRVDGLDVLRSAFPASRSVGSLVDVSAGLWCGIAGPRESPEQGVEWVGPDVSLPFRPDAGPSDGDSWTVEWVRGDPTSVSVRVDATAHDGGETVINLVPASAGGDPVLLGGDADALWAVDASEDTWSASTTCVGLLLKDGRYLVVAPVAGDNPEVFVRSAPGGVYLSLLSRRRGNPARWRLAVRENRAHALAEMSGVVRRQRGADPGTSSEETPRASAREGGRRSAVG